ncbi:MAG TPA: 4-hydroxy-tetrahydrodipicolinate reductase [Patescibacteria group bacterium]|nr:4-hydroxy-tetrahydrodipicolinate reductase [Patescibacteria group bacterium]
MIKIGVLGGAGRMGQMIAREILAKQHAHANLHAAVEHNKSWAIGKDVGGILGIDPCGTCVTTSKHDAFKSCDVLIDFTTADALIEHAQLAHEHGRALVVGTTGLGEPEMAALKVASQKAPVLQAANMSLGVNILLSMVEKAAAMLDQEYDIEIFEAHHRHKIDAPSGTALALAESAAKGRGVSLDAALVPARYGQIGARPPGAIGVSVFRGGDVVGDHTVTFAGTGERIEFLHKASDRSLFAKGAVRAAMWLGGKPPGFYSMRDVLGI